jgi:hypothetical protein
MKLAEDGRNLEERKEVNEKRDNTDKTKVTQKT